MKPYYCLKICICFFLSCNIWCGEPVIEWTETFGGNEDDIIYSAQRTSDSGYILAGRTSSYGEGYSDAYFLKFDSSGVLEWEKNYGSDRSDVCYDIRQTNDNGYIATGDTDGYNVLLVKMDANGELEWLKVYDTFAAAGKSLVAVSDKFIVLANDRIMVIDNEGDILNEVGQGGRNIIQTNDNGFIVTSHKQTNSAFSHFFCYAFLRNCMTGPVNYNQHKLY